MALSLQAVVIRRRVSWIKINEWLACNDMIAVPNMDRPNHADFEGLDDFCVPLRHNLAFCYRNDVDLADDRPRHH